VSCEPRVRLVPLSRACALVQRWLDERRRPWTHVVLVDGVPALGAHEVELTPELRRRALEEVARRAAYAARRAR
jgi:hypothetical protein